MAGNGSWVVGMISLNHTLFDEPVFGLKPVGLAFVLEVEVLLGMSTASMTEMSNLD